MPDLPDLEKLEKLEKQEACLARLLALLPTHERRKRPALLEGGDDGGLQRLTQIILKAQLKKQNSYVVYIGVFLLNIVVFAMLAIVWSLPFSPLLAWALSTGASLLFAVVRATKPIRLERAAFELLYSMEDERCIEPLLEGWQRQHRSLRPETQTCLTRLLPRISATTFRRLSPIARTTLASFLNYDDRNMERDLRLATIAAIQHVGDGNSIGLLYLLASGQASSDTAQKVQGAAATCLTHLLAPLDFRHLESLPHYIDAAYRGQERAFFHTVLLAIRRLLPGLTPANYQSILPDYQRYQLYNLIWMHPQFFEFQGGAAGLGRQEMQLEIIQTAERLGDIYAVGALQTYLRHAANQRYARIESAAHQALHTLSPLAERAMQGRTLLRGAAAPMTGQQELLRAVTPTASNIDPLELLRPTTTSSENTSILPVRQAEEPQQQTLNLKNDRDRLQ